MNRTKVANGWELFTYDSGAAPEMQRVVAGAGKVTVYISNLDVIEIDMSEAKHGCTIPVRVLLMLLGAHETWKATR